MSRAIALTRAMTPAAALERAQESARMGIVLGCSAALILAGQATPLLF
ncbi:MAG: hypothetical protein AAF127_06280 [Pseudomonadota bacterium]